MASGGGVLMVSYRSLIIKSVIQPDMGIRRIQKGVTSITSGTTVIPISSLISPSNKVYIITSHLDNDRTTGSQGYTATLDYNQEEIIVTVADSSPSGSISWQVIEVY